MKITKFCTNNRDTKLTIKVYHKITKLNKNLAKIPLGNNKLVSKSIVHYHYSIVNPHWTNAKVAMYKLTGLPATPIQAKIHCSTIIPNMVVHMLSSHMNH